MPSKLRWHAYRAVKDAIAGGELTPLSDARCVGCGGQAVEYHHFAGYAEEHRLDVEPVCRACHSRRERFTEGHVKRLTVELLPGEEAIVRRLRSAAIARGETLRDVVMRALREVAKREAEGG